MNKRLESLIGRIPTWPQEAQDWAALALAEVEEKVRVLQSLTPEDRAKLDAPRETINRSIEQGGSYTDEEVAAGIAAELDAWETRRKRAQVPRLRYGGEGSAKHASNAQAVGIISESEAKVFFGS